MQAVLLATDENEKLWPLTERHASPMIPLGNQPLMAYAIELLARHGVKKIVVCVHHLAAGIESHFRLGQRWGVALEYILQRDAMGTAGSLKLAQRALNETFIVLPADVVLDLDIAQALEAHYSAGNAATVIVNRPGAGRGVAHGLNGKERETIRNRLMGANGKNVTGAYIFEPVVLRHIPSQTDFDIQSQLIPQLAAAGLTVGQHETSGYFNPLNSFGDYQSAQRSLLRSFRQADANQSGRFGSHLPTRQLMDGVWLGRKSYVDPTACLTPPVLIGANCRIGRNAEIGPNVVLGDDVVVDDDATICDSTVLDGTYIGQLVHVKDRVIDGRLVVDVVSGKHVRVADAFLVNEYRGAIRLSLRRIVDVIIAATVLLCLSPFMLVIGALLWMTTGRVWERVGRVIPASEQPAAGRPNVKTVELLHFSTQAADGRDHGLGRWLKEWEFDRLPELWDVLRGVICLVGVKPLTPAEARQLKEEWQQRRNEYCAGFTGLWYVQNDRESQLLEEVIADIYYIATRSLWEDLSLIGRTPFSWLIRVSSVASPEQPREGEKRDEDLIATDW